MKAVNNFVVIDKIKQEEKKTSGLIMTENTNDDVRYLKGKVISVGPGVTKVSEGNWVILGWIKGKGKDVKGAKYILGDQVINSGPVTTFSTYSIVSENRVVNLPEYIPKDLAVLFGCALPTGSGILLNEIKPRKNSKLAFVGLGGIGLSSLMASSIFECEEIIAIDVSEDKLKLAKKFGATHKAFVKKLSDLLK